MSDPTRVDEFVQLLGQNQRRLFLYVRTLVPHPADAEEVLAETNLVLWREFGQFRSGTNFAAWACRVALNQVLAWRSAGSRDRLQFGVDFLEAVAEQAAADADALEERAEALAGCVEKLPARHRDLLRLRYGEGRSIEAISAETGRTIEAVYRALSRIREALYDCVSRAIRR